MTRPEDAPSPQKRMRAISPIGLREFLRGGYHDIKEPVLVMNRRKPVAIWTPVDPSEVTIPHK